MAGPSVELNSVTLAGRPSLIEVAQMRFLIFDAPKEDNLPQYLLECKRHNVTHLVRVCQCTYSSTQVESAGIMMHEMEYADGSHPPSDVIAKWLDVVEDAFPSRPPTTEKGPCIAVHCVAGLGRAPVLVAIALIEYAHMDAVDAVGLIRSERRGAINTNQLNYLEKYVPTRGNNGCGGSCVIA